MLDIGWSELLVIAIVLIVVVGPKDLPPMLRAFGKMTANLRKMAGEFRTQFDEALRESELDDVKNTIADAHRLNPTNALRDAINPLRQMGQDIKNDLQKATQMPSSPVMTPADPAATLSDVEAQQAVEGTTPVEYEPEVPSFAPAAAASTASASTLSPVTSAPATSVPAATPAGAAATSGTTAPARSVPAAAPAVISEPVAAKPKAARKTAAKAQHAADPASQEAAAKPRRTRAAAKPAPVAAAAPAAQVAETAPAKAPARKRVTKKTEASKDDA